jgi:hypothetical protein
MMSSCRVAMPAARLASARAIANGRLANIADRSSAIVQP